VAHFYGKVQGNRGEATRTGSKNSGMSSSAMGWDLGGTVVMDYNPDLDTDVVKFYTTRDNGRLSSLVASFAVVDGKLTCLETNYPEILI
jgi:hypothetical protein